MIFSKLPHVSYPGEAPGLEHTTISLRTQLRLSYETYAWLRYLTWGGLLLVALLLLILPGGVPPQVALLLWQKLPQTGSLVAAHGAAALFSLGVLGFQTLTWLILWALLLTICYKLIRYDRSKRKGQAILNSGWLSSSTLSQGAAPITLARTAPLDSKFAPALLPTGARMRALERAPLPASTSSAKLSPADSSTQVLVRSLGPTPTQAPVRSPAAALSQASADSSLARQFAQPTLVPARPHLPSTLSGEFSLGWGLNLAPGNPGIAWDPGIKRKGRPNEDSVLTLRGTCNFDERLLPFELHVIADGMGGHAQGRLASHLAIRSILETVVPGLISCNEVQSEQIVDILIDGVHWANQVIYQHGQENSADMGTTVTAVLLLDESAYVVNVGDSRTYVYRPGVGLTQITRDHSLVARLVETGAITPDEIYTHPDRNKVYRGLGDKTDVTVDWFVLPVQSNDLLLLCSDGLWEMVRDPRIAEILQTYASSPTLASNALLRAALQAGGSDNVSSLVVKVA